MKFIVASFTQDLVFTKAFGTGMELFEYNDKSDAVKPLYALPLDAPQALKIFDDGTIVCGQELGFGDYFEATKGSLRDHLTVVKLDMETNKMQLVRQIPNHGFTICHSHIRVIDGVRIIFFTNYIFGDIGMYSLDAILRGDEECYLGKLPCTENTTPVRINTHRQQSGHTHCCLTHPNNPSLAFVPMLGVDAVAQFTVQATPGYAGKLPVVKTKFNGLCKLPPGSGPRSIEFNPCNPTILYCSLELTCELAILRADEKGDMKVLQIASILPKTHKFNPPADSGASICVDATGRTFYASVRGHESIAIFALTKDGTFANDGIPVRWVDSLGTVPRFMTIDPTNRFLFVANHGGEPETHNVVIFERLEDSFDLKKRCVIPVKSPNWVEFLPESKALKSKL
jgi:6-phosphogluconolactonase